MRRRDARRRKRLVPGPRCSTSRPTRHPCSVSVGVRKLVVGIFDVLFTRSRWKSAQEAEEEEEEEGKTACWLALALFASPSENPRYPCLVVPRRFPGGSHFLFLFLAHAPVSFVYVRLRERFFFPRSLRMQGAM